jgi:signal transduction histidine kinase
MTGDFLNYAYLIGLVLVAQLALVVIILTYDRHGNPQRNSASLGAEVTHHARLVLAGELTASIAHEIAQPLGAILNNVETAELILKQRHDAADADTLAPILADIKRDDLRANEVVNRLRALLRKRELKLEPMDINTLVNSALTLIRADAGRRMVQLRIELEPDLPPVAVDPVHLQQVVLNLLVNGMDAMNKTPPPARCLHVRTRLRAGSAVEIAVRDNGHGIDPAHAGRLFDSFFTTKEGGMGLGLSIARSIVQAHGGTIWADRGRGGGSIFAFRLPLPQRQRPPRVGIPQLTSSGG